MNTVMDDLNAPATKGDLLSVKNELKNEVAELRSKLDESANMLRSEMQHLNDHLTEGFRDMQTEMLKAFYGYMGTSDSRLKDMEGSDVFLRQRLTILEARITDLEKKLITPQGPTQ